MKKFWVRILKSKKILSNKEADDIMLNLNKLRKEDGFRY